MKLGHFVEGVSNVQRFLSDHRLVEQRGAPEANWHLVKGEPGFGKSRTLVWWGGKRTNVVVRAKADWTPTWMLRDMCACLGLQPHRYKHVMFESVCTELMAKGSPPIVVDEIDHAARHYGVLETLRDITDTSESILVAGGMKDSEAAMRRYPQIRSRIAKVTHFGPATADDVRAVCEQLCDLDLAPDLAEEIRRVTQGRVRLVMNAIARVERYAKAVRGRVCVEHLKGKALIADDDRAAVPAEIAA